MFLEATREFAVRHGLFHGIHRVLAGVSGGPDSVALLRVLDLLRREVPFDLAVMHVNHGLRDAAGEDEEFVRELAARLGVECHVRHVDVHARCEALGESIEMAARALRHEELRAVAESSSAGVIALGHTRADQIETVLINLLRGTGARGLAGMRPSARGIVRPIIWASRAQVLGFLSEQGLPHREDETNREPFALRNRIRHELVPLIGALGGEAGVVRASRIGELQSSALDFLADAWLNDRSEAASADGATMLLPTAALAGLPDGALHAIVRRATERVCGHLFGLELAHVEGIVRLIRHGGTPATILLPVGAEWARGARGMRVTREREPAPAAPFECPAQVPLLVPGETDFAGSGIWFVTEERAGNECLRDPACLTVTMDAQAASGGLWVRTWRPGDRVRPIGMTGRSRKLKELFREKRVPLEWRKVYPLVVDGNGQPLWAPGLVLSESVKVTAETERVIVLRCHVPSGQEVRRED